MERSEPPAYEILHDKCRRSELPDSFRLRLRRSLSWFGQAREAASDHVKCVFLWVSFNAAYADEGRDEQRKYGRYLRHLMSLDRRRVHDVVSGCLNAHVSDLMSNEFVFQGYWDTLDSPDEREKQKARFDDDRRGVEEWIRYAEHVDRLEPRDFPELERRGQRSLEAVFSRLYVLRNQLMHGLATEGSSMGRRQADAGARILEVLVPVFLDIMMDHPHGDWGKVPYPVHERSRWWMAPGGHDA